MIAGLEDMSGGTICDRRDGGERPRAERAQHRHGVSELRALPAYDGRREHGLCAASCAASPRAEIETRGRRGRDPWARASCSTACPRSSRAASASAWRWAAPSSANPQVFLFDEPLSNLDAKLRVQMRAEIKRAAPAARHHDDLRDARPDRGDDHGRPHRRDERRTGGAGWASRLRAVRPAAEPVRGRLHRQSCDELLPGRIEDGGSSPRRGSRRRCKKNLPLRAGRAVVGGIRPDQLALGEAGARAEVAVVEPTGAETLVVLKAAAASSTR